VADAANHVSAVRRLRQMRPLCVGLGRGEEFRDYVASLREENRRRPRFLSELDRGLGGLA
jgi:16S rRNA U1498 N3-methylase RsmE